MKKWLLASLLIFSHASFAEDISCVARSVIGEDFTKVSVQTKDGAYKVSRVGAGKILETKSIDIDGPGINSCAKLGKSGYLSCVKKLLPNSRDKNDSVRMLNTMLVHIHLIRNHPEDVSDLMDIPTEQDFNIDQVASGSLELFEYAGKNPGHGIYSYKDASGNLLARFYFKYFPSLCK